MGTLCYLRSAEFNAAGRSSEQKINQVERGEDRASRRTTGQRFRIYVVRRSPAATGSRLTVKHIESIDGHDLIPAILRLRHQADGQIKAMQTLL